MSSSMEYEERRKRDMIQAQEIVDKINGDPRPYVKYKESRPITDLKHMIDSSTEKYGDHTAFHQKMVKGGSYEQITYRQMLEMVNGLGTALIEAGMKGKRIAVIGDNCYQWAVSYLALALIHIRRCRRSTLVRTWW